MASELQKRLGDWLRGAEFTHKEWRQLAENWTHDHCQLCNSQIRELPLDGDYSEGYVFYTSSDGQPSKFSGLGYTFIPAPLEGDGVPTWICPPCFDRFRYEFDWKLKAPLTGGQFAP